MLTAHLISKRYSIEPILKVNHLDIASRARFEQAMGQFDGTILAVVHDRFFYGAIRKPYVGSGGRKNPGEGSSGQVGIALAAWNHNNSILL